MASYSRVEITSGRRCGSYDKDDAAARRIFVGDTVTIVVVSVCTRVYNAMSSNGNGDVKLI